jgi:MFS family permease
MPIRTLLAASAGALIEAYDFFLFGVMAVIFAELFFPVGDGLIGLLKSLGAVWVGLAIRPVGAVLFGALGDRIGRKYTFVFTLLLMGIGTGGVGFLPTYAQAGYWAPALLVALRILQGLAYGGEYGGAAISIAENAPDGRRGFYTSFIQVTAAAGFLLALGTVLAVQFSMDAQAFLAYGWRIPFLIAALLVAVSGYIRGKMRESPLFIRAKALGLTSKHPLRESLASGRNLGLILLVIFGGTVAQSVIFYTSEVYAGVFLQKTLKVDFLTTNLCLGIALAASTPMFVVFGALSDRFGRKPFIAGGSLVAALTLAPTYWAMTRLAADPAHVAWAPLTLLLLFQMIVMASVFGPIAGFLVEQFPAAIRYTSLSVTYHVSNGVIGGAAPLIGVALAGWAASHGLPGFSLYAGILYPTALCLIGFFVNLFLMPESAKFRIWDEVGGAEFSAGTPAGFAEEKA